MHIEREMGQANLITEIIHSSSFPAKCNKVSYSNDFQAQIDHYAIKFPISIRPKIYFSAIGYGKFFRLEGHILRDRDTTFCLRGPEK